MIQTRYNNEIRTYFLMYQIAIGLYADGIEDQRRIAAGAAVTVVYLILVGQVVLLIRAGMIQDLPAVGSHRSGLHGDVAVLPEAEHESLRPHEPDTAIRQQEQAYRRPAFF